MRVLSLNRLRRRFDPEENAVIIVYDTPGAMGTQYDMIGGWWVRIFRPFTTMTSQLKPVRRRVEHVSTLILNPPSNATSLSHI